MGRREDQEVARLEKVVREREANAPIKKTRIDERIIEARRKLDEAKKRAAARKAKV